MAPCSEIAAKIRTLLCAAVLLAAAPAGAEPRCQVLDPELQGHYEGACVGGLAQGEAIAEGTARYVGGFSAGRKSGRGTKVWPNGDRYEGGFQDDTRHGVGTYLWGEGSPWKGERYQGSYVNDRRDGYGVYEWPNGDRYAGQWREDQMFGPLTPMQVQQARHEKALVSALEKPGTKVCRIAGPGKTAEFTASGETVAVDGKRLTIRLTDPLSRIGAVRRQDPVIEESTADWRPCY
jgi:hypothetical protein